MIPPQLRQFPATFCPTSARGWRASATSFKVSQEAPRILGERIERQFQASDVIEGSLGNDFACDVDVTEFGSCEEAREGVRFLLVASGEKQVAKT